jgi:hypothetical protein
MFNHLTTILWAMITRNIHSMTLKRSRPGSHGVRDVRDAFLVAGGTVGSEASESTAETAFGRTSGNLHYPLVI